MLYLSDVVARCCDNMSAATSEAAERTEGNERTEGTEVGDTEQMKKSPIDPKSLFGRLQTESIGGRAWSWNVEHSGRA